MLQEFWVVTNRGILGPSQYHDCVQSIRVLGRIVEWTDEGISWEADPRHAELIRKSFGVTGRSVSTSKVKDRLDDMEGEISLGEEAAGRYRANTMRAQYLSSDRLEIQIGCRDLARNLQQPSNLDEMGLKRLALYLGVRRRLVLVVQVAKTCHSYRILARHGSCWLHSDQEERFWLCVDAGKQYGLHMLQRSGRDRTQLQ